MSISEKKKKLQELVKICENTDIIFETRETITEFCIRLNSNDYLFDPTFIEIGRSDEQEIIINKLLDRAITFYENLKISHFGK
jgi:hypothetical protein